MSEPSIRDSLPSSVVTRGKDGEIISEFDAERPSVTLAGRMRFPVTNLEGADRIYRGVRSVLAWDRIFKERGAECVPGEAWSAVSLAIGPALGEEAFSLDTTGEEPTWKQVRAMMEAFARLAGLDPREALSPGKRCLLNRSFFARRGIDDPAEFFRSRLYRGWKDEGGAEQAPPVPDGKPDQDRIRAILMGPQATTAREATTELLAKITAMIAPEARAKMERDMYLFSAGNPGMLAQGSDWADEPFFRSAAPTDPADFGPREKYEAFRWFTEGLYAPTSWVPGCLADPEAAWCALADRLADPAAWAAMCRTDVRNRYRLACALLHPELRPARALVLLAETLCPELPGLLEGYRETMRAVREGKPGPTGCVLFSAELHFAAKFLSPVPGEDEVPWQPAPAFLGWGSDHSRGGVRAAGPLLDATAEEVRKLDADPTASAWHALSVRPTGDAFGHGKVYLGSSWEGTCGRDALAILAGRELAGSFPAFAADVPAALDEACVQMAGEYGEDTADWAVRAFGGGWAAGFRAWMEGKKEGLADGEGAEDFGGYFARFAAREFWDAGSRAVGAPETVHAGIRSLPRPMREAALADMSAERVPSSTPRSYAALFRELGPERSRRKLACEAAPRGVPVGTDPATPALLAGPLLECVLADFLAAAEAAHGAYAAHLDYPFLARWLREDPEIGPRLPEAASLLCSLEFRTAWWRKAAPHLAVFRVPFLVLMLKERLTDRRSASAPAEALDAARRAASAGVPAGWRVPDAKGEYAREPRPWERPPFNAGLFYSGPLPETAKGKEYGAKADAFADDVAMALRVESDREQEAFALAKSMQARTSYFDQREMELLGPLLGASSSRATVARWLKADGNAAAGADADEVIGNLRPHYDSYLDLAVLWVDVTPEGKAMTERFRGKSVAEGAGWGPQADLRPAIAEAVFESSPFAVPETRALLMTLSGREAASARAMDEFFRDAGRERWALIGENAEAIRIIEAEVMSCRSPLPRRDPRSRERR